MASTRKLGINVAGRPAPGNELADPAALMVAGVSMARLVYFQGYDARPYLFALRDHGIDPLLVFARESFDGEPWHEVLRTARARYGDVCNVIQAGNESDLANSPSSWTMDPHEISRLLAIARQEWPDCHLIGPGMASGDPSYLDNVDLTPADSIAVHGYGQQPEPNWPHPNWGFGYIGDLLEQYRRFERPIWMTEIGLSTHEVTEEFQAEYCRRMMRFAQARDYVSACLWFCFSDSQV